MNDATNDKTVDFKDIKRRMKIEQIKRKIFSTIEDNLHIIVPAVGAIALKVIKDVYRDARENKEERDLRCKFYDRRTDSYSWSKRPLKPREALELDERYARGERKKEVLREMGLLKY